MKMSKRDLNDNFYKLLKFIDDNNLKIEIRLLAEDVDSPGTYRVVTAQQVTINGDTPWGLTIV